MRRRPRVASLWVRSRHALFNASALRTLTPPLYFKIDLNDLQHRALAAATYVPLLRGRGVCRLGALHASPTSLLDII